MSFKKIGLHALELAIVLAGAFVIIRFLPVDNVVIQSVVAIALGALAKTYRVLWNDYVND